MAYGCEHLPDVWDAADRSMMVNRGLQQVFREFCATYKRFRSKAPLRACHYTELFVNSSGEVYPCCLSWGRKSMRIGHLDDPDLSVKIAGFGGICSCERFRLRKGKVAGHHRYLLLNLELSLLCQAQCAMCCVNAPGWRGEYDYYRQLEAMIDQLLPAEILVQGGEVLVQKPSIDWLSKVKNKHPGMKISLVTNGNVNDQITAAVGDLFSRVTISFVGFQAETYRKVMGLDIENSQRYAEQVMKNAGADVYLKYLLTPINVHETALFLKWAIDKAPKRIAISDASTHKYIKNTDDRYWQKIYERTGGDVRSIICKSIDIIKSNGIIFSIDQGSRAILGIDDEFIDANDFRKNIDWT